MCHAQWFVKFYEIINFFIQNNMILLQPPYFLMMLPVLQGIYNCVHNSKLSAIDKKDFRIKFQVN